MANEIAVILPNTLACESTRQVLKEMKLNYPVYRATEDEAVYIAKKLADEGTLVIISAGIALEYIKKNVSINVLEMPFSGLETAIAIKEALKSSKKIVHLGTPHLFNQIKMALDFMEIPIDFISFRQLDMSKSIESQTINAINEGFDFFIGGYIVVTTAEKYGKKGAEVNISNQEIVTAIGDAQSLSKTLSHLNYQIDLQRAIMKASTDGIIAVDNSNKILLSNPAARRILPGNNVGRDLFEAMKDNNIVDIDKVSVASLDPDIKYTPIITSSAPFVLDDKKSGTVYSVKEIPDFESNKYMKRQDLYVQGLWAEHTFDSICGSSRAISLAKEQARVYANYKSPVLITGETGTGKEVFAQSIHNASRQKLCPWVPVNCASLPENLIESELFGYEKGAFTGASKEGKKGFFELADKGTILLDEISEIPITIQSKLLRVIQEGDVIRVGSNQIIHVDVRVICTSNKDLLKLIAEGKFKEDLYYRLNVLEINLPPLRERREDIEALALTFLYKFRKIHEKNILGFAPEVLQQLKDLPLRGNVRELSNIIERLVIFENDTFVSLQTFLETVNTSSINHFSNHNPQESALPAQTTVESRAQIAGGGNLKDIQKDLIFATLEKNKGNKAATARELGIDPSTLWRKLKKYELD